MEIPISLTKPAPTVTVAIQLRSVPHGVTGDRGIDVITLVLRCILLSECRLVFANVSWGFEVVKALVRSLGEDIGCRSSVVAPGDDGLPLLSINIAPVAYAILNTGLHR